MFSTKRSLSLASFKLLPAPRKISLIPGGGGGGKSAGSENNPESGGSGTGNNRKGGGADPDHKYLVANAAKGELDSLTLESLININDVGSIKPAISPAHSG